MIPPGTISLVIWYRGGTKTLVIWYRGYRNGGVPIHCDSGERQLRMETILNQRQNDEREGVSSSVVGYQPTMALERARVVQLMRGAHTVASTSIFLKVEKTMSRNTSAHLVTERQCALVKALQISAASLHLNLLKKALNLKLDGLCSSQSTMSHFWQVITLLSSLRKFSRLENR